MAALTANRNTVSRSGSLREPPVKGGVKIYAGAMVAIDASGLGIPAAAVAALRVIGRSEDLVDNTAGANGDVRAKVTTGIFAYGNSSGADLIGLKDVGQPCYAVDDQTVALTDSAAARPRAGTIFDVDQLGVWVKFS
ncbi:hypothetical protein [Methylobacterium sp. WL6]|uniref:hypothetical protein n=1 Tax=Methylobacterium sp. WL6 TaxID=2603901 RepID=UPI0011C959CA|nr:hypothetical protein [Methylobacterium sp. WL6]TXN71647.1 hypothetical protein FV230_07820 [Methylobacterium sp. WL6]